MDPAKDRLEKGNKCVLPYLPGSQTDACTYSLVHQLPVVRLYPSKVGQEWPAGAVREMYGDGPDGLQTYIDFCRKSGYEAFWAMRANDTHDAGGGDHGRMRWESNEWKKAHPEYLVGSRDKRPPFGAWSAFDYSHPEVREKLFRLFEEVCLNYDIDGMMIDFFRHLSFFRSTAYGGTATSTETEMMTQLLRRLRKMMDEVGAKRGRPILFAVRTPDSTGFSKALGLDVERWMKEGIIDIWIVTGYFRMQEWKETVAVARKFDVPVWASLDESRVAAGRDSLYNSRESYRARAMNAWRGGVDSLWLFNFFYLPGSPQFELLRELGDPAQLTRLDKVYVPDARGRGNARRLLNSAERFFTRPETFSPQQPADLKPGQGVSVNLLISDDLSRSALGEIQPRLRLEIETEGLKTSTGLNVRLNSRTLKGGNLSERVLSFVLNPSLVQLGPNRIDVALQKEHSAATLRDLRLWIRYPSSASSR
jgi:GNAT superfamily N-acetyltransferase